MSDDAARPGGGVRPLPEAVYRRALEVGRTAAGRSGPNPPVGCLIVRDDRIIGEGATGPVGGPHAEVSALDAAGAGACGAIAVVTLEPCAHHGRTPPCTDALVAAGIVEVHVLHRDPDPVARGGCERLRASGIDVLEVAEVAPTIAAQASHDLRGFIARVAHGRPHVHLKLAQDAEGRTEAVTDRYLTGREARERVHLLRAEVDAVLVGGATVRRDDPRLDVRHVAGGRHPRAVILTRSADLPVDALVLRPGSIVVTGSDAPTSTVERWRSIGVDVVTVPLDGDDGLDLRAALEALLDRRILTVLAEPGPRLVAALLAQQLVDVVELHVAGGAAVVPGSIRPALDALRPLLGEEAIHRRVTRDGDLLLRGVTASDARVPEVIG